ncbi:GNAT family N-acetyltransferase [Niallia nealsonii]|uniref:GNAT family N-acetyltransferase n=1 Tax=Niallia nealsonii TaxID=115979 RepID=A0A2N0Z383_9BACI|nr:GNAT family N-acetyltransferase [Niallia nealsonii]PKG23981.1 GNAT family N-acetyltransferase [Niallia nealsonii]
MFPIIVSERLVLRELTEKDAAAVLRCFSNEKVLQYYGQQPLRNIEQVKGIIQNFHDSLKEKQGIKWGIQRKEDDSMIGTIGFQNWSVEHKKAELSYALLPEYWGYGYAAETVSEIVRFGLDKMDLLRIGAVVFTENEASNKLLVKLGFEKEGVLRKYLHQNGVPHDTNIYSFIK